MFCTWLGQPQVHWLPGEAWGKGQVDTRLDMSQQKAVPANKANHTLGSTWRSVSSRSNYSLPLHTWNIVSQCGCLPPPIQDSCAEAGADPVERYQNGPGGRQHNIQKAERPGLVLSDEEVVMK